MLTLKYTLSIKKLFNFFYITGLLLSTAYAEPKPDPNSEKKEIKPNQTEIRVTDFLNREVRLTKPAKRIVALAPHIVENLYSAGAGKAIVGAVDYSDYPESANTIPRVGSMNGYSLETIIATNPDLIIVWYSGQSSKIIDKLESLNLNVYVSDPHTLSDISKSIRDYGVLANTSSIAETQARAIEQRHKKLKQQYAHKSRVSTLYQVWNAPIQTINGEHIISDVIRICGGDNIFANAQSIAPKISIESVIALDPKVIIASGMDEERPEWLEEWRAWPSLHAVKHNHLFFVPPDIIQRHTARILDGAAMICEQLDSTRAD